VQCILNFDKDQHLRFGRLCAKEFEADDSERDALRNEPKGHFSSQIRSA
jgi:hypothetical protein